MGEGEARFTIVFFSSYKNTIISSEQQGIYLLSETDLGWHRGGRLMTSGCGEMCAGIGFLGLGRER